MGNGIKELKELSSFLNNKKIQWILTIIVFLVILSVSVNIRLSNLEILKDSTTGEYLSNDLDSMYFYRQAETQLEQGSLPEVDERRSPGYEVGWVNEIIDNALIWNYKLLKTINPDITFNYASTISAPIFFAIGLTLFFILSLLLLKSKAGSLVTCALLAFAPGFLFRSIAGFYDHDHIGVFALFALMIFVFLGIKYFEKNYKSTIFWSTIIGFFTSLVLVSWGGAITFVLVSFPIISLLYYLFNNQDKKKFLLFYLIWMVSSIIFTPLLGADSGLMLGRFTDSQGILVLFVLLYTLLDFLIIKLYNKKSFLKKKYHQFYVFGSTIVLGILGLLAMGKSPFAMIRKAWATLIYPFFGEFTGRLSATVAENSQPYLTELIAQNGKIMFWLFLLGLLFVAINLARNSSKIKNKIILSSSTFLLFFAILFSRYSSASLFNGENFISQTLYLLGAVVFITGVAVVYSREKFKIDVGEIILFAIAVTVVMNARAAIRSFFLITPFIALIAGYGLLSLWKKYKGSKEETLKVILAVSLVLLLIISFYNIYLNYQTSSAQAQYVGPSANIQWQNAMSWVRNNTSPRDVFVHWWDYGYFLQTLGKRPTVTDGGHSGGDSTIHYIGRYILTTPKPETAYSFMKTWNVSYLLIDPTEMGKYGAFSKIGSNESWDRVSAGIFSGASDDSQTIETSKGMTKVYVLGGCVDEDIIYTENNSRIFLPGITVTQQQRMVCNSYVAGVIMDFGIDEENKTFMKQPIGVFFYNNNQYRIPLKNVYFGGQMISFEEGVDSVIYIIPEVDEQKGVIDQTGAVIYLSPRTFNSLMGRLYILDDYYNEYEGLILAHKEDSPVVDYFKQFTNGELSEFIYYNGLQAPLKIWEVNYPQDTPIYEEFLKREIPVYGGLDYLFE
ncbi:MAG: STT3 domain-containing protein [Candidatus Pacearchaeota archaeon]